MKVLVVDGTMYFDLLNDGEDPHEAFDRMVQLLDQCDIAVQTYGLEVREEI